MPRTPSQRELAELLVAHGIVDFVSGGKLAKYESRALWSILKKLGPATARAVPSAGMRLAGTAIGATRFVVMRHPYVAAAVVTYEAIKHREQIAQLAREGWEVVQELPGQFEEVRETREEFDRERFGHFLLKPKKRASKFNKAISAGMKAVKRSKFLGKPGKFTNSKTAFSRVTKTVARLRKGAKVARKGVTGIIARAVKRYI